MTQSFSSSDGSASSSGVSRFQMGAPTEDAAPIPLPSLTKVGGSTERLVMGAAGVQTAAENSGVSRHQTGQDAPTHSVMATAKRIGGKLTVELTPGLPASRTTIDQALRDGLVEHSGDGHYKDLKGPSGRTEDADGVPSQGANEKTSEATPNEWFKPEEDEAFAADIAPLHQHAYDSAAALATIATLNGTDLDAATERLAREQGMGPEEAAEMVANVYDYYEQAVFRSLTPEGITEANKQDFYEFARSRPRELESAIEQLRHGRDVTGFKNLAVMYRGKASQGQQ